MASQEPTGSEEYRELAELLEERLSRPTSDASGEGDEARLRLVRLYLETLGDPERAAQHVEKLLERVEVSSESLELATALLEERKVAPRIAELLSDTYARLGRVASEATTLTRELRIARSARLKRVRRRLADLKFRELDDPDGALELLEPLVAKDPADDDARASYIEIATALERRLEAAALLTRALKGVKDDEQRARVGLALATLLLQEGELPQARAALSNVVQLKSSGADQLAAARRLLDLEPDPGDPEVVAPALAAIVRADPDKAERNQAATRLLRLSESHSLDESLLVDAHRALIDSPSGKDSLAWLESFYTRSGDQRALAEVYGLHAARTENPALARSLALRRIRLASSDPANAEQTIADFRDFFERFGPALDTHADFISLLELLERHERWQELALALDTAIEFSPLEERAELLGKLGELRLTQLGAPEGAFEALGQSLALQPANPQSRRAVEQMLETGEWRLRAAELLERVYRQTASHDGLLGVLEIRAELSPDANERMAALAAWAEAAAEHDPDRVVALCRRMLELDPTSPELLVRLDALLGDREPVAERILRYETALALTAEPERRRSLMHALVAIRRDVLGDVPSTIDVLERLLAEHPSDLDAHLALIDAIATVGDTTGVLRAVEHALAQSQGHARHALTFKKALILARSGHAGSALVLFRELLADPELDPKLVESIAYAANDEDDPELYRRALELLASVGDAEAKKRALERLGDYQFEQLGNPRAAAESWKPAAELYEDEPGEEEHARQLYERVLEALPDDRDAARRLVELYAHLNEWGKVPEAFSVLIRSEGDPSPTVELLLELERGAAAAGAVDEFVSMVDEAIWRLGPDSSVKLRQLKRARARTLATNPAREEQASQAYRDLVDCFESEEDLRDFQAFCEARPSADERHRDRRWLYDWRARHTPRPIEVLSDWAKAEELQGELETAITVYERLANANPKGIEWPEPLCRLKFSTGDFEGGLGAFRALENIADESQRRAAELRIARLLFQELGRPLDAIEALLPLLGESSESSEAQEMLRSVLGDAALRPDAIDRLEQLAGAATGSGAARIYELLARSLGPGDVEPERRGRWFERVIEFGASDPQAALSAAVRGVVDVPEQISLWDAAERLAQQLEQPEQVANAYHDALVKRRLSPELAEILGRRLIAYSEQWSTNPLALVEALSSVLVLVPKARWALDRVKLALSSQGRWDELLALYDRAISAASKDAERADLLDEAAVVAKDLARDSERAIHYLDRLHRLRPNDTVVGSTLERLYERHGHTHELIELLGERLTAATGFQRQELRRRIATLWFDLGRPDEAEAIVERMLEDGASISELKALFERVIDQPANRRAEQRPSAIQRAQKRAIELLETYYQELGQTDDLIRITEVELSLGNDAPVRGRAMRKLLRLRFQAHANEPAPFARIMAELEPEVSGDKKLAKVAYETMLLRAIGTLRQVRAETAADAAAAAYRALQELKNLLVAGGWPGRAVRLFWHASHLSFEHQRRRELLGEAAEACSIHLDDSTLALRIYRELFAADAGDDVAAGAVERFAELLERLKRETELAELREQRASSEAARGNAAAERAEWERAAALWERQKAWDRALQAHSRSAQLGSLTSLESLARIHVARTEWRQAAEALEQLYESAPADARADVALRLADAHLELGERAVARAQLEHALDAASDAGPIRARLLALYREDAVLRPLAELLKDEARRTDDNASKLALLREAAELLLFKLEDATDAAAVLDDALSIAPHDLELCLWRADALGALERWDEAIELFRAQLEGYAAHRSKERARVHHRLARILTRAERRSEALTELRLAAEMHQSHPAILYDLGKLALAENELEAAEAAYRALVLALHHPIEDPAQAPDRAEVYLDLAEIAAKKGDADRASDLIDSAFDAVHTGSGDAVRFEKALRDRGQNELFVRAVVRRVESESPLKSRISGLESLAEFWNAELARAPELMKQIVRHADRLRRELERESHRELDAWLGLAAVETLLGDRDRLVRLLESAISEVGPERNRPLRLRLANSLLEDQARKDAAISLLSAILEEDPDDAQAAELLANALERDGRLELLASLLEQRFQKRRSSGVFPAGLGLQLGRVLEKLERTSDALSIYESVLAARPTDRDTLESLGERLAAVGSDRVADCLELRTSVEPEAVPALARRLLELRERARDRAGVLRALKLGFAAEPKDGVFRDRLVKLHEEEGDFIEVARILGRALEALPRDRTLLRRLIEAYRKCGDEHQALEAIDRALCLRPKDPELLGERAALRASLGDHEAALSDLESAAAVNPRSLEAHVELLQKLVDRSSLSDEKCLLLTDLLLGAKRTDLARAALEGLFRRSPNHAEGLKRAAALASADGDWQAAISADRRLLGIIDSDPRELAAVTLALADACDRAGRPDDARHELERALEKLPENAELAQKLERLYIASGDSGRLAELLVTRVEQQPDRAAKLRLLLRAAKLLAADRADLPRALEVVELALAVDSQSIDALLLMARIEVLSERPAEALTVLEQTQSAMRGNRTPLAATVQLEIAKAHLAMDDIFPAFDALKAGYAIDRKNGELCYLLGLVALDLEDEKTSDKGLHSVTMLSPKEDTGDPPIGREIKAISFYHLALLALAKNDLSRVRRFLTKAVAEDPNNSAARALLDEVGSSSSQAATRQY